MAPARHASTWERLCEAALNYADADAEGDGGAFMRSRDRLRKAAVAYALDTTKGAEVVRHRMRRVIVASYRTSQLAFWPRSQPRTERPTGLTMAVGGG